MFGWFRKKESGNGATTMPKELYFKSNQAAFEYACKYLDHSIESEKPALAIVLSTAGSSASIKLANAQDSSIPTQDPSDIEDLSNICLAASKLDRVPPLKRGDLAMFVLPHEFATLGAGGRHAALIVAKIEPILSLQRGGWKIATS